MNEPKRNRTHMVPALYDVAKASLAKTYLTVREGLGRKIRGQTMTEYALILAAIAVLVFIAYQTMGQTINSMVEWQTIDVYLTSS